MSPKQGKIVLFAGAFILFVLLFIAPKVLTSEQEAIKKDEMAAARSSNLNLNANVDVYLNMALKTIEPGLKTKAEQWQAVSNNDSLSKLWDRLKRPDLASLYIERKALKSNKAEDWFLAGNRYYYSVQFIQDETERPILFQSAIRCFKNGLRSDPNNVDAKIMMASCFVEGTDAPMEGITLLKEVEKRDSNNVKLHLTFAFFSVKSGQTDKAIARFNKVLQLDPTYIEAYLHLADIYEQMNKVDKTIEALESYASKTNDPTSKLEVEKYIKQLKLK